MYQNYNANPIARRSNDCAVRAISKLLDKSWEEVYCSLCEYGLRNYDMPSSNYVWGQYLHDNGYTRHMMPDTCPHCYTVGRFADEHPYGKYLLSLDGHVVCCIDGIVYDTWDCLDAPVIFYWRK